MTENAFTRRDNDNGDSNGEDGGRGVGRMTERGAGVAGERFW